MIGQPMNYFNDIKAERAKYTVLFGKTMRGSEAESLSNRTLKDKEVISKISYNTINDDPLYQIHEKLIDDLVKAGKYRHPFLDAILESELVEDAKSLSENFFHKRRKKSSRLVSISIVAGVAIGGGLGFVLLPAAGPFIGSTLGGLLGAIGGTVIALSTALFIKKQSENLAKKWYPQEYHYDLNKKTTRELKNKYGFPEHVSQLVHGYLQNRLKNVADVNLQNHIALLIKLGIENQRQESMPQLISFLDYELIDIKKFYDEKLKEYDEFKKKSNNKNSQEYHLAINEKDNYLKSLALDYRLIQYVLKQIKETKVENHLVFSFEGNFEHWEQPLRTIADSHHEHDNRIVHDTHSHRLSEIDQVLKEAAIPSTDFNPNFSNYSPRKKNNHLSVGTIISRLLTDSELIDYDNAVIESFLKNSGIQVKVDINEDGVREYRYPDQIQPIKFLQRLNDSQIFGEFNVPFFGIEADLKIDGIAINLLKQVDILLEQNLNAFNDIEIDIEPNQNLSSAHRIASAYHLIRGLNERGIAYQLINFSNEEKEKIYNLLNNKSSKRRKISPRSSKNR